MHKNNHEPKLCPNCPNKSWIDYVRQVLLDQQYTQQKVEPSLFKICQELRRLTPLLNLKPCPYFNETETIDYHTNPQLKQEIDRKNELLKRQNLQHFL